MKALFEPNGKKLRQLKILSISLVIPLLLIPSGCGGSASTAQQVNQFEKAGPFMPLSEQGSQLHATRSEGYQVAPGDVLEIQMPLVLNDIAQFPHENQPYLCRVNESGNIPLPIVGEINVAGKTLIEIEEIIAKEYYPKYIINPPAVVCKINELIDKKTFTVTGLVKEPGIFPYPTGTRYSLIDAIASAGGVDQIADPRYAKIYRHNQEGKIIAAVFKIDKKSIINASNVTIKPGDIVSVEPTLQTQTNTTLSQILRINVGAYMDARN
jgi:polysaccharide export outer membrane protein